MIELDPLKTLGWQLDIDFERDTFPVVMNKLAAKGLATFRLHLKEDIVVCVTFKAAASQRIVAALEEYLETLA